MRMSWATFAMIRVDSLEVTELWGCKFRGAFYASFMFF